MSIDAMKTALEALEYFTDTSATTMDKAIAEDAIATLRHAIKQAEKQEPLFLLYTGEIDSSGEQDEWDIVQARLLRDLRVDEFCAANPGQTVPLYTAPPQRQPHELLCVCGASWSIDSEGNEELLSTPPQRQPLTEEEIAEIAWDWKSGGPIDFARAIERKHGIGGGE